MPRKVLIVDDDAINRELLKHTLGSDYDTLEAHNGKEALVLMHRHYRLLSAVLLDIMMPVMDGYGVLRAMQDNAVLTQIPVIMVTGSDDEESRVKALSLGANDFITKPYNPLIVRHCLHNNIALRETASILNAIQRDKLTGLFNREAFFEKVEATIRRGEPGHYILSSFDIDNFKLINDQYGAAEGDRILREVGVAVRANMEAIGGICCRVSADNFAALFPADRRDTNILERIEDKTLVMLKQQAIVFSVGRYVITDVSLAASAIYDRAYIAKQSVKGRYDKHMAYFDEDMLIQLVRDQQMVTEMEAALSGESFEIWFQPQFNHATGQLIGAEALARWRHSQKGIVPPGEFIPLFERNGFVYELDKYIWRSACRFLRKWLDGGRRPPSLSVNVSRYDIFRPDMVDELCSYVKEFDVPPELLCLEVTESAFSKSTDLVVEVVKRLVDLGFTVEIDDFGSGYSSLNTLKSVPAQIVKLDMRFFDNEDGTGRSGKILESVVRMTKWLGMSVIAEGVETSAQGDFLMSIGCNNVQGYLYARPMPAAEYETLCRETEWGQRQEPLETVGHLNSGAFWDPESMDTLIFNSYVGAACIVETNTGRVELVRATEKLAHMLGAETAADVLKLDVSAYLRACCDDEALAKMRQSLQERKETTLELRLPELPGRPHETYIRTTMRVIATAGERQLIYCISEDVTAEKLMPLELLDNLPGGAAIFKYEGGIISTVHLNSRFWELVERQPVKCAGASVLEGVHPDDRSAVMTEVAAAAAAGRDAVCDIRILRGADDYRAFHVVGRLIPHGEDKFTIYVTYTPMSGESLSVQAMLSVALEAMMASSTDLSFVKDRGLRYICCSRAFASMVGLDSEKDVVGKTDYDLFDSSFADQYSADDRRLIDSGSSIVDLVERIPSASGRDRYSRTSKYLLHDAFGTVVGLYGTGRDITRAMEAENQQKFLLNNIPGGVAIYEGTWSTLKSIKLTYFSDGFCKLFGYTREEYEQLGNKNPTGLVSTEYLPGLVAQITALVSDGTPLDYIYRAFGKGGMSRWIHIIAVRGEGHGDNMTVNAVLFDVTERQEALERLRVSEEENRLAMQHSSSLVCRYDVAAKTLKVSPLADPIFEFPALVEDVPDSQIREGRISPETSASYTDFYAGIRQGKSSGSMTFQRKSTQGWRWIEARYSTIFGSDGAPVSAVVSFADATESYEREAAYKKWMQSLQNKETRAYSLLRCNVTRNTIYDTVEGTLMDGSFLSDLNRFDEDLAAYAKSRVADEDIKSFISFADAGSMLEKYHRGERIISLEYREKLEEDSFRWLRLTVDLVEYVHSDDVEAYLLFEDIDEAKRAELLMLERAETDPLTGILNRGAFTGKMDAIIRDRGPNVNHALLMLDVDGFKLVNDAFGHAAGDQTLIDIANLLRLIIRRDDLVGRLGGDEFVVFLNDVPGDKIIATKAKQICELSRKAFSDEVHISGSVGIARCPQDGTSFEALYRKADVTLYHVKATGRDNFAFYNEDMKEEAPPQPREPAALRGVLRKAERKRRMLIVEDNQLDMTMLSNMFKDEYAIEKARDGNAALIRLRHYGSAISVVLLDLIMPVMDGFEVLDKIRQSAEMRSIPVVVVSGDGQRDTSLRAIRAGASDYVLKPVDPDILRIRVESAISKAENERLRAKNSFLELQNNETALYRQVLERMGVAVAEMDWGKGAFTYGAMLPELLGGIYDDRTLWHILLSDLVADPETVKQIQQLVHDVAGDRNRDTGSTTERMRTPSGERREFRVSVYKLKNDYGLTDKIILAFADTNA